MIGLLYFAFLPLYGKMYPASIRIATLFEAGGHTGITRKNFSINLTHSPFFYKGLAKTIFSAWVKKA